MNKPRIFSHSSLLEYRKRTWWFRGTNGYLFGSYHSFQYTLNQFHLALKNGAIHRKPYS